MNLKTGRMKEEEFRRDKAKMPRWKERREEGGGGWGSGAFAQLLLESSPDPAGQRASPCRPDSEVQLPA